MRLGFSGEPSKRKTYGPNLDARCCRHAGVLHTKPGKLAATSTQITPEGFPAPPLRVGWRNGGGGREGIQCKGICHSQERRSCCVGRPGRKRDAALKFLQGPRDKPPAGNLHQQVTPAQPRRDSRKEPADKTQRPRTSETQPPNRPRGVLAQKETPRLRGCFPPPVGKLHTPKRVLGSEKSKPPTPPGSREAEAASRNAWKEPRILSGGAPDWSRLRAGVA